MIIGRAFGTMSRRDDGKISQIRRFFFARRASPGSFVDPVFKISSSSLLGAPDMSAVPEDARGLRRASGGNASVAPRDTEKLARLRRARKEAARDIEAERRTDDARVTELHAQLDAKLRERNERRARLLRLESERIGVEREVRFAHAAAERDAAATRLDAGRGDETAKKEARRAAFHARRRAAATKNAVASRAAAEERWERLNETVADEAARTPRLRETRRPVSYDAMARAFRETNEGVAANEDIVAAFESAAAVSAASPVPPPPPPTEFEFAPPSVAARVTSPSRDDAATRAARLGVSRGREDRLRRVANECGVLDDILETETGATPFVAGSDSDDARSDVSDDSAESVLESAPGIESPDRMRGRMRVRGGGGRVDVAVLRAARRARRRARRARPPGSREPPESLRDPETFAFEPSFGVQRERHVQRAGDVRHRLARPGAADARRGGGGGVARSIPARRARARRARAPRGGRRGPRPSRRDTRRGLAFEPNEASS
jgi:hypothetical protein